MFHPFFKFTASPAAVPFLHRLLIGKQKLLFVLVIHISIFCRPILTWFYIYIYPSQTRKTWTNLSCFFVKEKNWHARMFLSTWYLSHLACWKIRWSSHLKAHSSGQIIVTALESWLVRGNPKLFQVSELLWFIIDQLWFPLLFVIIIFVPDLWTISESIIFI